MLCLEWWPRNWSDPWLYVWRPDTHRIPQAEIRRLAAGLYIWGNMFDILKDDV